MATLEHLRLIIQEASSQVVPTALQITFFPIIDGAIRRDWEGRVTLPQGLDEDERDEFDILRRRWIRLNSIVRRFGREELEVDGERKEIQLGVRGLAVDSGSNGPHLFATFAEPFGPQDMYQVLTYSFLDHSVDEQMGPDRYGELTASEKRLVASIIASTTAFAWRRVRKAVGSKPEATGHQIFISYRSGQEQFAMALAERLGKEGFTPWFDKWEVLAGDSVPGKIAEGLRESVAFLPIITADYKQGKWATEELHTAIAKRVENEYTITPILLEETEKPELISHLRHVDFTDQNPETYESKIAEVIDGINRLSLNPFR